MANQSSNFDKKIEKELGKSFMGIPVRGEPKLGEEWYVQLGIGSLTRMLITDLTPLTVELRGLDSCKPKTRYKRCDIELVELVAIKSSSHSGPCSEVMAPGPPQECVLGGEVLTHNKEVPPWRTE